jgi:hypothetical protein
MKILMPVEVFYPSQAGGAANSVHFITKYLDKDKFEIVVVATDKGLEQNVPRNRWLDNESGRVQYVRTRSLRFPIRAALNSLFNMRQADVVHAASIYFPTALISVIAASVLKKKL